MQKKKLITIAEHFLDFHIGKPSGLEVFGLEQVLRQGRRYYLSLPPQGVQLEI